MAGMLPGVESARRRGFHQSGDSPCVPAHGCTRRSSFCLYARNHTSFNLSSASSPRRRVLNEDEKLGERAREAKERLDMKLRHQTKSATRSFRDGSSGGGVGRRSVAAGDFKTEVFRSRKNGSKRLKWMKFRWRASEEDECVICLERFKPAEQLMHLLCAHRLFHTVCLVPWLQRNSRCPCCRVEVRLF
ncbi:hypothetical protein K2173_020807 [Erythroxylum novogranatense]|uniref:RING-type domain-containing protein n=1 Tax=Erythroxylum novogranatense TaxID=1862640 RepID=A0AAV8TLZ7_9ROSI|nr:hypothetical protein K2173_020807 [Erythroxylum novogranatense]